MSRHTQERYAPVIEAALQCFTEAEAAQLRRNVVWQLAPADHPTSPRSADASSLSGVITVYPRSARYRDRELKFVLVHELTHVLRGDIGGSEHTDLIEALTDIEAAHRAGISTQEVATWLRR